MDTEKLNYVLKKDNPPNVPQLRPIKKFWALCKEKYSKIKKTPKDVKEFTRIWSKICKEVAEASGKVLMESIRRKVGLVGRKGIRALVDTYNWELWQPTFFPGWLITIP